MLNVLIVDDELIVRKGLKALINWEEYDMDVVSEATNGEDAMQIINDKSIDLLITDIRMPLMDGIELTRKVKENFQQIKVMLLTCYNDFEYVQEALQLGASGYLLKTELEDGNLEKQLLKISKEIKNERVNRETYRELEIKAKKSSVLLHENQIKSIMEGGSPELLTLDEWKWLHEPNVFLKVMFGKLDFPIEVIKENVHSIFKDDLSITFQSDHQSLVTIISLSGKTSQIRLLKWQEQVINQLSCLVKEFTQEFSIYYIRCEHIDSLFNKYGLLMSTSIKHCFYYGYGMLLNIDQLSRDLHATSYQDNIRELHELTILRDWDKVKKLCEAILDLYESIQLDPEIVKMNVVTMVETIMMALQSNSALFTSSWGSNSIDYKEKVKEILFFHELKKWFNDGFDILEENRLIFIGGMNQVVSRAVAFIETNYFREITLEDLSAEACLSQSYLSTIFKKGTGKSFIEYLNDLRIEKAKQLFFTSNLKVFEVAERVGFNDPKYFSKQFKRITGVSPKNYKSN